MDKIEQLHDVLSDYKDDSTLVISTAFSDGGAHLIIPRLERAAINQIESDNAVYSRYGVWANSVRDTLLEALKNIDANNIDVAKDHIRRSINGLSAFSDIQAILDVDRD